LLALLSFVFIRVPVKMVRAEEISTQHLEGILVQFNLVFREVLPKEIPHHVACALTGLSIFVVERLGMRCFEQDVELGTIRVRQTNEIAPRVHSGRAGEIGISALLAKVLLALSALLLTEALRKSDLGEMTHRFSLMARFAQHRPNIYVSFNADALLGIMNRR